MYATSNPSTANTLRQNMNNLCSRDRQAAQSLLQALSTWGWSTKQAHYAAKLAARSHKEAPSVTQANAWAGSPERQQQIQAIADVHNKLKGRLCDWEINFIESVMRQANQRPLSDKQWFILNNMESKIEEREAKKQAFINRPAEEKLDGAFKSMLVMFQLAHNHKKRPAVLLATEDGTKIRLTVAGSRSRYPGQIHVASKSYGDAYYGRIDKEGNFWPGKNINGQVKKALNDFAADPMQAAKAYGHRTGSCCFCDKELSTKESVTAGYGPVCAKNHGLAWG